MIPLLRTRFDRVALPLAGLGLAAVAAFNWRLWRRDRAFLDARPAPEPLLPPVDWPALPPISVLVAAWNEAARIDGHIESFRALRYPRKELVLCAGGDDGTYERACRHGGPAVIVLRQEPGEGKQRALARAFAETRGEIIFLTDADCLLTDEAFERTLRPVAIGEEQAATGGSRPLDGQLADSFVFAQAAAQLYPALHGPEYAPGILGCNCAVRRSLLVRTAALEVPAPTGTDYVLARTLLAAGARIRYVPDSQMPTEFPRDPGIYIDQQRRWVKNLALRGYRHKDWYHVRAAGVSMFVGLAMIVLPFLIPILGVSIALTCLVLWAHVFLARQRYIRFLQDFEGVSGSQASLSMGVATAWMEFIAWARAAVELLSGKGRNKW